MNTLCPSCGFKNPPGMRFCGNCGARLAGASSPPPLSTGTDLAPEGLGVMMGADLIERFHKAGLEAAGQRRNVTILFADLSGYTSLSERMDGEDLFDLVRQYIRLLMNDVYRYEGLVDKLTGDGLMALFGAPIAHENNAERAVRAALDMQADVEQLSRQLKADLGVEISMHVGLHAGAVIVGGVGLDMMMNYTAIGDTVNLARRIEEAAPPESILVSETVFRQTRALFDYQQVSVLNPKGIAHPVIAYSLLGAKARPGLVRGIEGLRAPMIGRDLQLQQLKEALNALLRRKKGQFVWITGEAGLGKSRLTAEFKASLDPFTVRVLEGQSQAYRRAVPYWIFVDLFYNYLGLDPATPPLQVRERLVQNIYQSMGSQAGEVLSYFEHLLSLPYSDPAMAERLRYLDAGQFRQQTFLAVRDLLLVEASRRPILLILEDLHWADDASLDLLRFLLESLHHAPIFILAISREVQTGMMTTISEWGLQHLADAFRAIPLQSLSLDQSERLLTQLLTIPDLPETLREYILQRASGIPFYLEEILRMLIDEGMIQREVDCWRLVPGADPSSLGVPDTLQGLILARFDRLDLMQRHVLQVAAVIGKNFNLPVLNAVLQPDDPRQTHMALSALIEREFILPRSGELDTEYTFRHILMSDAIYGTLLRRERSRLHGQVGEAIETLYADRLEGQIELLANHYRWSPHLDRALHYLILAGQKAARNNVNEQSRQHFETALELLPKAEHLPYQEMQVHTGLGDALVFAGDYLAARQHYQIALLPLDSRALDGQEGAHGTHLFAEERSMLYRKIAKTSERQGDHEQALAHLSEAQEALSFAQTPHPVELAQIWNDIGWIHFRRGNFLEAQQLLQQALDLVISSDAYDAIASIYNRLGGIAYNQGDWDRAAGFLRKSIAIRESIRDVVGLASSFNNLGYLEVELGEFDNALENLTRSYELNKRLGQAEGIPAVLNNLGWLRILRGETEEASLALNSALDLARQIGYSSLLWQILKNFGELHLANQDWDKAAESLIELVSVLSGLGANDRLLGANDQLLDTYRLLGEAALGRGDGSAALAWSAKARELLQALGDEENELSAIQRGELRRFWGMLACSQGDWPGAAKALRESESIFQKLRSRLYQGRVAYQLGALAEAQGDRRSAQLRFREATLLFQSIGAKLEGMRAEEACSRQYA